MIEKDKECPENFEKLIVKNQYHGNFSVFYIGYSFCIERINDTKYSYENLLKSTDQNCLGKICGTLNSDPKSTLCFENTVNCPLNKFDMIPSSTCRDNQIQLGDNGLCFAPSFEDKANQVIIDIEIINNVKLCLEKFDQENTLECAFPDNNECYLVDDFKEIHNPTLTSNFLHTPENLVKWNFQNSSEFDNFCNSQNFFHILVKSYINFTYEKLQNFKTEFPEKDFHNNSLYKTYEAYESDDKIDILFYLFSFILFCWSLFCFILQILLYFTSLKIEPLYFWNKRILLFVKLFCFFGMIIYHYCFYLKIQKVYLIMLDKSRNELLNIYSSTRNYFITKTIIMWIVGFIVICLDLIILIIDKIWIKKNIIENEIKSRNNIVNTEVNPIITINEELNHDKPPKNPYVIHNEKSNNEKSNNEKSNNEKSNNEKPNNGKSNNEKNNKKSNNEKTDGGSEEKTNKIINENEDNNLIEIPHIQSKKSSMSSLFYDENTSEIKKLTFFFQNNKDEEYEIKVDINKPFENAIKKLQEDNPKLKEVRSFNKITCFFGSKVINKAKSIKENGITENAKIAIFSDSIIR